VAWAIRRIALVPKTWPILEYDDAREALIEPRRVVKAADVPEHVVPCFFFEVIEKVRQEHGARVAHAMRSEMGLHPMYEIELHGQRLGFFHPGIGAPLAVGLLEEAIALGCRKFIACGSAGVLDSTLECHRIVVPTSAVRDEGTSYHYLPPSREVAASPEAIAAIERTLTRHGIDYALGKTWTTDAFYRETRQRIARRRAEGCDMVEMEAASFFAVAQFRSVSFGQMLYSGDDCGGDEWDGREWNTPSSIPIRERLFWLAAEACLAL
jgi:uridine phosphorylase